MLPRTYRRKYESNFESGEDFELTDEPVVTEIKREPQDVYAVPFARVSRTVRRYSKEEEDAEVHQNGETFDWDAIGYEESSSFFDNSSTLDDLLGVKSSQTVNRKSSSASSSSTKVRKWLDRNDLPHPSKLRSSGRDKKRKRRDDNHVQHHVAQLKKKRTDFGCFRLAAINATDERVRAKRESDNTKQLENFQPYTHSVKSVRDKGGFRGFESATFTPSPAWSTPAHCGTSGVQQVPTMSPAESNFLQYSTDLDGGNVGKPFFDQASYWTAALQVMEPQQTYCQECTSGSCLASSDGQHHIPHAMEPRHKSPQVSSPLSVNVESPACIINPDPLGILATMRQRGPEVFQRFMNLYTEE